MTLMDTPDTGLGESPAFTEMAAAISRLAPIDRPVVILGERGTGKELAARRLHFLSRRWDKPWVAVNCAAIAPDLLDSELFGHEAGAFTGATRRRPGRFELADGGTLFLDEIATAPQGLQERLLRVIEYGGFTRVGGVTELRADVRVIAATNADLRVLAADGRFRADLLDRLVFDAVLVPPLRDRAEDIPLLANHFGLAMARHLEWPEFKGFTKRAMAVLERDPWPGNIRALKACVERSVARTAPPGGPVTDIVLDPFEGFSGPPAPAPDSGGADPGGPAPVAPGQPVDLKAHLAAEERRLIVGALAAHRHRQTETARALGLTYEQLRGLLKKYKLNTDR